MRSYSEVVHSSGGQVPPTPPTVVAMGRGQVRFNLLPTVALFHREAEPKQLSIMGRPNSKAPQAPGLLATKSFPRSCLHAKHHPLTAFNPMLLSRSATQLLHWQSNEHGTREELPSNSGT